MHVPEWTRRKTQANHTGTHLLHAALRKVLGESVRQMGSLVAPDRLRFDYAASRPTTAEEIREIERLVNEEILRDREVGKAVMSMDDAKKKGAIMFFGEKYGERVRVVDVPGFSTELCAGCHVGRTGEIGAFKVLSDRGLAAGVRRLEAVTSLNAVARLQKDEEILSNMAQTANVPHDELPAKLREALDSLRRKEKEIAALKRDLALAGAGGLGAGTRVGSGAAGLSSAQPGASASGHSPSKQGLSSNSTRGDETAGNDGVVEIAGIKVLARRVPSLPANELRNLADTFRSKLKSGVVLLGNGAGRQSDSARGGYVGPRGPGLRPRAGASHGSRRRGEGRRKARSRASGRQGRGADRAGSRPGRREGAGEALPLTLYRAEL